MLRAIYRIVTVGLSDTVIAQANPRRRALLISSDGTATLWVALGQAAANKSGLTLTAQTTVLALDAARYGSALTLETHALASVAGTQVAVLEALEDE